MATTTVATPALPQWVGRVTTRWTVMMVTATAVLGVGIWAYAREASQGMAATGMRDIGLGGGATWGVYITFVIYFVGVSFAGITVAALVRLLDLERLRPVARMAEVLTVVSLLLGAIAIVADLGQPLRGLVNLFRYARPQSPFFGTFTLVIAGYLFASLVYLFLDGRRDAAILARTPTRLRWLHRLWASGYRDTEGERERHRRASFWLAVGIVPLLVIAHSTLGFVFGLQIGRPGWYSALQAPAFVVLAGASGIGALIVLAAIVRLSHHHARELPVETFATLGRILMILLVTYGYFMVVELLSATYASGGGAEERVTDAILRGDYAWIYWSSVGLLAVALVVTLFEGLSRRWSVPLLVVASIAANVGAIGKRFLIVVPSQTHGTLLPYPSGSYAPSGIEIAVIAGLFALGVLMLGVFEKVFPLLELSESEEVPHA